MKAKESMRRNIAEIKRLKGDHELARVCLKAAVHSKSQNLGETIVSQQRRTQEFYRALAQEVYAIVEKVDKLQEAGAETTAIAAYLGSAATDLENRFLKNVDGPMKKVADETVQRLRALYADSVESRKVSYEHQVIAVSLRAELEKLQAKYVTLEQRMAEMPQNNGDIAEAVRQARKEHQPVEVPMFDTKKLEYLLKAE